VSRFTLTRRGDLGGRERILRIAAGALAAIAFALLPGSGGPAVLARLGVATLGVAFVVTGVRGYCPVYARLGLGRPHSKTGPSW